jgi:putative acetyltransferase
LTKLEGITIRKIEPSDNQTIATIIRSALKEFGADKPGTVYYDESTDHLFELFDQEKMGFYYVVVLHNQVLGGAGIYPTEGLPQGVCELVKMYLLKNVRGLGLGKMLIEKCMETAVELGYTKMYLETLPELKNAVYLYEKMGFERLKNPLGNSGHTSCDIWMLRDITD